MKSIEMPVKEKELSPEEKRIEEERNISVKIERRVMEKYIPTLMLQNKSLTLREAQFEWIKKHAADFRRIFESDRSVILEMYKRGEGLENAVDYIESRL
jgi:hypothetical protein